MVQVGTRSFSDGSLASDTQTKTFDIKTQEGLLALLQNLHRSAIDQDEKNGLRDLVFSYSQSPTAQKHQQLVKVFEEFGFAILSDIKAEAPQKTLTPEAPQKTSKTFGRARLAPSFAQAQKVAAVSAEQTPPPMQEEVKVETPPAPAPAPVQEDIQKETPENSASASEESGVTYGNPLERIREIKHAVNLKVGNPVALIDIDATVGREYMDALLNAMKLSNGGNAQELNAAMERLESVYKKVETLPLDTKSETPVQEAEKKPEVKAPDTPKEVLKSVPAERPVEEVKVPVQSNVPKAEEEPNTAAPLASVSAVLKEKEQPKVEEPVVESKPVTRDEVLEQKKPPVAKPETSGGITSVGKEKQIQDLMQSNRVQQVEEHKKQEAIERANTEPLQLPEVTAGLNQLLSEWSLFKSSGFFGVGPSGVDHPLYKKLQGLTMAAVIAGRFEGATPQIKQSITDYMNGWRYEEGVIHEHAETFEHYLRRVIKHILDKKENS